MPARPSCFRLLRQADWRAFSRAWAKTGNRIAARMAMIAMTTSSSIRVKPRCRLNMILPPWVPQAGFMACTLFSEPCGMGVLQVSAQERASPPPINCSPSGYGFLCPGVIQYLHGARAQERDTAPHANIESPGCSESHRRGARRADDEKPDIA